MSRSFQLAEDRQFAQPLFIVIGEEYFCYTADFIFHFFELEKLACYIVFIVNNDGRRKEGA